jgi:hypothetical protein
MDHFDLYALRRQNALLARRLQLVESILEVTGIIDAALAGRMFDDAIGHFGGVIGASVDYGPDDLGRLSKAQLEMTLHNITAERTRLDVFESMIQNEIKAYAPAS